MNTPLPSSIKTCSGKKMPTEPNNIVSDSLAAIETLILDNILLSLLLLTYAPATYKCFGFRAPAEGDFLQKKNQSYNQVSFDI